MMADLTPQARELLQEYLRQVRSFVSAAGKADPEDVLRDVQEHIERELHGAVSPVSADDLGRVLDRLGEPSSWISTDDLPWWRKTILRLRIGPEDWRLAYATFGIILVGVLFGWIFCETSRWGDAVRHEFNWSALAIFTAISFVLARATIAGHGSSKVIPPAQKWMIYPPLIAVYIFLATIILGWAPLAAGATYWTYVWELSGIREGVAASPRHQFSAAAHTGAVASAVGGLWWAALGLLLRIRLGPVAQAVFRPLLDDCLKVVRKVILIAGIGLLIAAAMLAIGRCH